jgi:hypothetical protein
MNSGRGAGPRSRFCRRPVPRACRSASAAGEALARINQRVTVTWHRATWRPADETSPPHVLTGPAAADPSGSQRQHDRPRPGRHTVLCRTKSSVWRSCVLWQRRRATTAPPVSLERISTARCGAPPPPGVLSWPSADGGVRRRGKWGGALMWPSDEFV